MPNEILISLTNTFLNIILNELFKMYFSFICLKTLQFACLSYSIQCHERGHSDSQGRSTEQTQILVLEAGWADNVIK